jgi:hypothetical protein
MSIIYLREVILTAFNNVKLGEGIGLRQAQAIDDYESKETQALARSKDIKDDWTLIPSSELLHCESSLCYFDAQGMLFHIPAFLIAELNKTTDFGPVDSLVSLAISNPDIFSLFNNNQKRCVATFLEWCAIQPEYDDDKPVIQRSLFEYWYKN